MMLAPVLNGANVANEWQPISALTCTLPSSFCTIFIDEKNGRSGQPVHKPGGRGGTALRNSSSGSSGRSAGAAVAASPESCGTQPRGAHFARNPLMPALTTAPVYSPAIGSGPLPATPP